MNLPLFHNCGYALFLFLNVIYECKPMSFRSSDECPRPCKCFVNSVDCARCDLKQLPNFGGWATNVSLSGNFLPEIPVFNNSSNIVVLDLSHNAIQKIGASSLYMLKHLKFLDLSNNQLTKIAINSFPYDSRIQTLVLNNNEIMSIEDGSMDTLQELVDLRLNRNHVSYLNRGLFKFLKSMYTFEMNRNKLTEIPGLAFQVMENLSVLKLRRNSLTKLFDGAFWGLKSATALHLDFNNLTAISRSWLYGLSSLQELFLNHNSIFIIESGAWEFCPNIVHLDVSQNKIEAIEVDTFGNLSKLKRLYLNRNRISYIADGAFSSTSSLEVLELSNNRISWTVEDLNGVFLGLKHLNRFGLAWNHIISLSKKAFEGLDRLQILDLGGNNITTIEENPFENLQHLENVIMNSTRLLCNCHLKWFTQWHEKHPFFEVDTFCSYPESVRNMPTVSVPLSEFKCDEFPQPEIMEDPKPMVAKSGDNITMYCKAVSSSHLPLSFVWRKDNRDIKHGQSIQLADSINGKITEHLSMLTLSNASESDSGRYQCVVSNKFGVAYSAKSMLSVVMYPRFVKVPVNVTVTSGNTARLECGAEGEPKPQIVWQKDGGNDFPAARERRMHVMPSDIIFFIVNAKAADSGSYSCIAKNQAGAVVANASVTVLESPKFVKPMENKEVTAGTSIVLECMASGSPKPKLTWTKDGNSLDATERHFFTAEDQLLIIVATELSDAGTYECELSNALGSRKEFSHLSVIPASNVALVENDMTGIIIITVVCCAVLTSIIWVFIIYHTRKRMGTSSMGNFSNSLLQHSTDLKTASSPPPAPAQFYVDTISEHSASKDSGNGDSTKRSTNDLLENFPGDGLASHIQSNHRCSRNYDHEDIHEQCSDGDCSQCWLSSHYRKDDEYSCSSLHGCHGVQVSHNDSGDEQTPCILSVQTVIG